ncbi:hypothetical protein [Aeromicrobium sp. 9AM]|uniref:hypothetical protein n=1 Tax=Aeromicrobium sp. 9AM TaxID=2653126 RepID=UPI00135706BC|nr:hypothetical protein [Aeromicrobium sp. 9AM]
MIATAPSAHDLALGMRQFIIDQAGGRTGETVERYVRAADDLEAFMNSVDVESWLGAEIAAHLDAERRRLGPGAFIVTLGLASLIRVLPAFLANPWLPPPGAQRRTHRSVVRRLKTRLRLEASQRGCLRREDFAAIERALGHAYSQDYADRTAGRAGMVTCTVTLDLVEHLVDRLLEGVTEGRYETLDEAISARLNPVQVTVWREPEEHWDHRGW